MSTTPIVPQEPELLPCPFCGGDAFLHETEEHSTIRGHKVKHWTVFCGRCDVNNKLFLDRDRAVNAWNRRVISAYPGLVALLSEQLSFDKYRIHTEDGPACQFCFIEWEYDGDTLETKAGTEYHAEDCWIIRVQKALTVHPAALAGQEQATTQPQQFFERVSASQFKGGHRLAGITMPYQTMVAALGDPHKNDEPDFPDDSSKVDVCWCVRSSHAPGDVVTFWNFKNGPAYTGEGTIEDIGHYSVYFSNEPFWLLVKLHIEDVYIMQNAAALSSGRGEEGAS